MKLNWIKVLLLYISMIWGGIVCWIVPIMSFKGWWKGAIIGIVMATFFLTALIGPELYQKLKLKFCKSTQA